MQNVIMSQMAKVLVVCNDISEVTGLLEPYRHFSLVDSPRIDYRPLPRKSDTSVATMAGSVKMSVSDVLAARFWPIAKDLDTAWEDPILRSAPLFQYGIDLYTWANPQGVASHFKLAESGSLFPMAKFMSSPVARMGSVRWDVFREREVEGWRRMRGMVETVRRSCGISEEVGVRVAEDLESLSPTEFAERWAAYGPRLKALLSMGELIAWAALSETDFLQMVSRCYSFAPMVIFDSGRCESRFCPWKDEEVGPVESLQSFYGRVSDALEAVPRDKLLVLLQCCG